MKNYDYPCWMIYNYRGGNTGSISFTRNTYKHPVLHEMAEKIVSVYAKIFQGNYLPSIKQVHLMKTMANVPVHIDENTRVSCINLGIYNTSGSILRVSNSLSVQNFYNSYEEYVLQDGFAYVLNVKQYHSIESTNNKPRYLITYSMNMDYDKVISCIT